jgi:mutator protein MutT
MRLYPGRWDAPGGHVEPGETPAEAIRRELSEEIGIVAESVSLLGTFERRTVPGLDEVLFHVFVITRWSGDPHLANDEHSELRWFEIADAEQMDLPHAAYGPLLAALRGA